MILSFNLNDIKYLKMDFHENDLLKSVKLALKEKEEKYFVAAVNKEDAVTIETPKKVFIQFVSDNGIYKTETILRNIEKDGEYVLYKLENPNELDYYQNREYYRILAEYDCIYTVSTSNGAESFNAVTYDLSPGGVSIIMPENITTTEESSILVFLPYRDIKSHLRFVRSEVHDKDFKLSFEFTDLSQENHKIIADLCLKKQLESKQQTF